MLSLKNSLTEQPARPEEAHAQAQAQEDAQAQEEAQEEAQEDAQEEWDVWLLELWEDPELRCPEERELKEDLEGVLTTLTMM